MRVADRVIEGTKITPRIVEATKIAKGTKVRVVALIWMIIAAAVDAQEPQGPVLGAPRVPTLVKPVVPDYPPAFATARMQGTVELDLTVQPSGEVSDTRIVRSTPELAGALAGVARSALMQWLFMPWNEGPPVEVRARVEFVFNEPALYPRPSRFDPPLPAWMPENFAFAYSYQCGDIVVAIDSIDRTIRTRGRPSEPTDSAPFQFDAQQASELLVRSVAAGVQQMAPDSMWQERPPIAAGIVRTAREIIVTVPAENPVVESFYPTDSANTHVHRLAIRLGSRWKLYDWREPPAGDRMDRARQLSGFGAEIRELVGRNSNPSPAIRECLAR